MEITQELVDPDAEDPSSLTNCVEKSPHARLRTEHDRNLHFYLANELGSIACLLISYNKYAHFTDRKRETSEETSLFHSILKVSSRGKSMPRFTSVQIPLLQLD